MNDYNVVKMWGIARCGIYVLMRDTERSKIRILCDDGYIIKVYEGNGLTISPENGGDKFEHFWGKPRNNTHGVLVTGERELYFTGVPGVNISMEDDDRIVVWHDNKKIMLLSTYSTYLFAGEQIIICDSEQFINIIKPPKRPQLAVVPE